MYTKEEWITGREVQELLLIDKTALARLRRQGVFKIWQVPGCRPRYSRADVEKLIKISENSSTLGG